MLHRHDWEAIGSQQVEWLPLSYEGQMSRELGLSGLLGLGRVNVRTRVLQRCLGCGSLRTEELRGAWGPAEVGVVSDLVRVDVDATGVMPSVSGRTGSGSNE